MVDTVNSGGASSTYLNRAQSGVKKAMNRLSTGLKINSAKDDAAGLAISDRMNVQIRGLNQAIRNANDGISLTQVADGALSESSDILQRMRELSLQASNGIYNSSDRASMNKEFSQLQTELGRISENTTFNGKQVLNGDLSGGASFQVGANEGETIEVALEGSSPQDLGVEELNIRSVDGAQNALAAIDDALATISARRGELGATQNRFESTIANLSNISENVSASRSRVADADYAAEVSNLLRSRILEQAGIAMQSHAKQSAETVLGLLK
ncbi:flagellin [Desulfopila sp. IMCC35008]|uniref:flagellin N-terminal helical domain-containing protein n=1 Tax=Desulfopila sp. IMCC35008 TaxID=2653858 RepID=UPI0013D1A7C1|nr:flagellin [Desulfopila sp. IMCC35008]